MIKRIFLLGSTVGFLLLCFQSFGAENTIFHIVEKGTKQKIENANVLWKIVGSKKSGFGSSDKNGTLDLPIPIGKKAVFEVSCVGYKTFSDTILVRQNNRLELVEDIFNLSKVVVLGSSKPTLIDKSIYKVKVIDKVKIQNSGATNLGDLLMTEPNINISNDLVLGTNFEMLGLDGNNVKIMLDGVPVIGRLNGQIDLNQIQTDNIEHIEIIEGPMSVVYGNNALAGTLNIITKKKPYFNTEVKVNTSCETAKRYAVGADISQKIGKSTLLLGGNYLNFQGVDFEKSTRSMEWKPKQDYSLNAGYLLKLNNWELDTKATLFNSRVTMKSDIQNYKVYDAHYFTERYTGSAKLQGKWNTNNHLNILFSNSFYNRLSQKETKDLTTLESFKGDKISSQKEQNTLLRSVWTHNFTTKNPLSFESGIDFNLSQMKGERIKDNKQNLNDYAVFCNVHYTPFKDIELQPGIRFAYNTGYKAPLVYSLNAKWNILDEKLNWRISVAKGFRAPTVKQLYYVFVNSNHEIYGNTDLKAEHSKHYSTTFDANFSWKEEHHLKVNLQGYYNDVNNLITLVARKNASGYEYNNIEKYKTRGGSLGASYFYKNWLRINASSIFTARYNNLSSVSNTNDFTHSWDWIVGLQCNEPTTQITLTADWKAYGKQKYFYYDNSKIKEGYQSSYQMLNLSASRRFWQNRLQIVVGARNLADVTNVKLNGRQTSSGHGGGDSTPIAYGRTFFIKANFRVTK